jgi:hypothetical protein
VPVNFTSAIEVKLTQRVTDGDVRHLRWLATQIGDELLDSIVVTAGPAAYRRPDRIAVVPAALRDSNKWPSTVPWAGRSRLSIGCFAQTLGSDVSVVNRV